MYGCCAFMRLRELIGQLTMVCGWIFEELECAAGVSHPSLQMAMQALTPSRYRHNAFMAGT